MSTITMPIPLAYMNSGKDEVLTGFQAQMPPRYQPPTFERISLPGPGRRSTHFSWMGEDLRHHVIAAIGEFVGTMLFLFFGLMAGQIANNKPDTLARADALTKSPSLLQMIFIAVGFGVSLTVNAWIFYRISGGMFNPAVTVGLWLAGAFPLQRVLWLIPAQLLGSITASALVTALVPSTLNVQTTLGSGTSIAQGLFIEMILTAELIFTIIMMAVEKHRATPFAPIAIGLALTAGHITGIGFTGASLNPARSFGPSVVLGSFVSYHWIYWLGPVLGAFLAVAFHRLLKLLEYETANSGQDDDGVATYRVVPWISSARRRGSMDSFASTAPLA